MAAQGEPVTTAQPEGINVERVTAWLADNVDGVTPPLDFRLIAGGHSNLTFAVTDAAGHRYVVRRPPLGHVLATAHDMRREHTIISALGPTPVPVAPALGLCMDDDVNGAPFYVMGFVDGHVVRDSATAATVLDGAGRRRAGESIADVMADIHDVDPDAVGLGELGRKEGYIARQLKRWHTQFEQSRTRELPVLDQVHAELQARIPEQGSATIVHGDYRLDNCLLDDDGRVVAVLDWEICTLGDPLADVGLLLVYWNDPGESDSAVLGSAPTSVEGFPTKAELVERYAARSGRDVSNLSFYVAFAYWKLACILEGVYARYAAGAMGEPAQGFEAFGKQVEKLVMMAQESLHESGG